MPHKIVFTSKVTRNYDLILFTKVSSVQSVFIKEFFEYNKELFGISAFCSILQRFVIEDCK
jgi:hypothetical protein